MRDSVVQVVHFYCPHRTSICITLVPEASQEPLGPTQLRRKTLKSLPQLHGLLLIFARHNDLIHTASTIQLKICHKGTSPL